MSPSLAKESQIVERETATRVGPELVIGIVSALGVPNRTMVEALAQALRAVDYDTREVAAVDLIFRLKGEPEPEAVRHELYNARMSAGNEFRRQLGRNDAIALAAIADIRDHRQQLTGDSRMPAPRCAYVIRSLKTPEEVAMLRQVYGSNFVLVAAYMSRE